ncbi:MAG: CHAD domain-containing protein [Eubacteriales bacterium]|nr:CHAD domain-containing protein [Eubacteriales bacterium]
MDIVLIRHATAQERSEATRDIARPLTREGRERFTARLPRLREHLPPEGQILIWSSPAVRAMQTAQILAREWKITNIAAFHWIYTGESAAFLRALSQAEDDATYIVVGHEPHLGDWSEALNGARVSFRKGGAAAFRLVDEAGPEAELLWTHRAEHPEADSNSLVKKTLTARDYKYAMIRLTHKMLFSFRKFLRHPYNPRATHKLRVQTRRGRSVIALIKPLTDEKEYRGIQEQLKGLARGFSRLRELDVLLAQCLEQMPQENTLCGIVKQAREEELKQVYMDAQGSAIPDTLLALLTRFSSWDEKTLEEKVSRADYAAKRVRKWRKSAGKAMKKLDLNDFEAIHAQRIRFKKLRYVQDIFPALTDGEDETRAALQEDLGLICDTYVNAALLKELAGAYSTPEFQEESESFRRNMLDTRMKLTEKYQAD